MRRITIVCGLLLLMTAAGASAAPLISSWSTASSASEPSATIRQNLRKKPAVARASSEHHGTMNRSRSSHAAPTILLGDQALESTVNENMVGTIEAFAFRARRSGTAVSINVYLAARDRAITLFAGLYSSSHGQPRSLLTSGSLRSPRAGAWNSVAVRSASLRSGKTYWLGVLGQGGAIYFRDRNGGLCTGERSSKRELRSLPGTWPAGPQSHVCLISAYVNGSSSAGTKVFGTNAPSRTTGTATGSAAPTSPAGSAPTTTAAPGASLTLPPLATAGPAISGSRVAGQTLTTSDGSWINSPTSYAYQWQDCDSLGVLCTDIGDATTSSYVLTSSDVGSTIRVVVTATNAGGSTPATSAATGVVTAPPAPSNTALPSISGQAVQGQVLTTSNGSWTGSPASYAYRWQDCNTASGSCVSISGATSSSYTLQASDVGSTIRVVVTATNAGGSTPATSAATGVVTAPPAPSNTALPSISGQAVQGQVLTTSNGSWTGSPASYAYRWQDCNTAGGSCVSISGATSSSYTLQASDGGSTIRSVVTATNVGGSTSASSPATGTVSNGTVPINTTAPALSGQAVQGQTLTTNNGSWSGSPTSYAYQWQDCTSSTCSNISGATGSSYTLQSSDVGDTIDVVVTAANANGSASATSGKTGTVSAVSGSICNLNATASNFAAQIAAASPGQVVCLASGDYSGFTGTSKAAPGITITSAPGAAVTFNSGMTLNMSTSQNFTLDGTAGGGTMSVGGTLDLETRSDAEQIKALNLTFQNLSFPTGNLPNVILFGPEQANIAFNRDTFVDGNGACSNGNGLGRPGNFYVYNTGTPTTQTGLTVENSVFVAPMDLWNPGRTVQDGAPMAFENNVLTGYVAHNDNAACVHIDGLQWFSGTPGTTGSVTFTGNLCYDDYGCALAFDGTSDNTVTDNVCFSMERSCTTLFADANSIYNHNAFETGGADPGYCNSMHSPQIGQMACTISRSFENGTKGGADPNPSGEVFTNNVSQAAPTVTAGSTATNSNNLYSGATAPNINGTPTFAGGADPTTWAGFELTAGSAGHTAGSDGLDVGIRASAGGPPTGGGSAPVNTVAPVLSGTATNGSTLTTTNGTWTITGGVPTAVTYQWFDCTTNSFSVSASTCQPIQPFNPASSTNSASNAANLSTLTISTAGPPAGVNVGDYVFAMVTETNANGQVNAISNPAGPVG